MPSLPESVWLLGAAFYLGPRAACGDKGSVLAAQRVGRDRRLRGDILAPVQQHLAGTQRLRHLPHDELGSQSGEIVCDLSRDVADRVGVLPARQSGIMLIRLRQVAWANAAVPTSRAR